ncbi:uncharacterized protein [Rutidosis leptorrhynchoides]|uniref:uncharacterized protein n=1 Tax=Rutidosis leptorrhynchoides TaxID=125765 RepID=UPI003A9A3FEC
MVIVSIAAWFTPTILFCVSNLIIATLFIASISNTTTKHNGHDHNYNHDQEYSFVQNISRVSLIVERVKSIKLSSYIPKIELSSYVPKIELSSYLPKIEIQNEYISTIKIAKYTSLSRLAQSIFSACSYDTQPDSERYPSSKPKPNPSPSLLGRLKSIDFSTIYNHTNIISTELKQVPNSVSQLVQVHDSTTQLVQVPLLLDRVKSLKTKKAKMKKACSEVKIVSDNEEEIVLRRPELARARHNADDDDAKADNFISKFRDQLKLQRLKSLDKYNDMLRSPN